MNKQNKFQTRRGKGGGDGRAKRSSAVEDEGQAAILLMPDSDRILVHIFVSLQLEALHVGALLYSIIRRDDTT